MNPTHSSVLGAAVPGYARLQRDMHDALLAQHPEWVEADGNSPTCDSYDARFAALLGLSSAAETMVLETMPAGHSQARNIVFHPVAAATGY